MGMYAVVIAHLQWNGIDKTYTSVEFFEDTRSGKQEEHLNGHNLGGRKPEGFELEFISCQQLLVQLGGIKRNKNRQ